MFVLARCQHFYILVCMLFGLRHYVKYKTWIDSEGFRPTIESVYIIYYYFHGSVYVDAV